MLRRFLGASLSGLFASLLFTSHAVAAPVFANVAMSTVPSVTSANINTVKVLISALGQTGTAVTTIQLHNPPTPTVVQINDPSGLYVPGTLGTANLVDITMNALLGSPPNDEITFDVANTTFTINLAPLATVNGSLNGIDLDLSKGTTTGTYTISSGVADLAGATGTLDNGQAGLTATGFLSLVTNFDFSVSPLSFSLPPGSSNANFSLTPGPVVSSNQYTVLMSVPLFLTTAITTSFGGVNLSLIANITMSGVATVPEASSLVLLGLAGAGAGFVVIRRRREKSC